MINFSKLLHNPYVVPRILIMKNNSTSINILKMSQITVELILITV